MRYITLLRAVNLGQHKKVGMSDLRDLATALGYDDATTLLNSGNLVFGAKSQPTAKIEQALEAGAKKRLGLDTEFYVRTPDEWAAAIAANPFRAEAKSDPGRFVLLTLRATPSSAAVKALEAAIVGPEYVKPGNRCLYMVYPDGQGQSKLTPAVILRKLGEPGTARNWNTVLKLAAATAE